MRSVSRKRSVSISSNEEGYSRQHSTRSGGGDFFTALTDQLSRLSMEDLPLASHPSPGPGRSKISHPYELPPDAFEATEEVCLKNYLHSLYIISVHSLYTHMHTHTNTYTNTHTHMHTHTHYNYTLFLPLFSKRPR